MDELNEFYKKVQMYFMKKNEECGELQFITSRITTENINHIDDICNIIVGIFEIYNIPVKEKALINNERCVQAYKYLLLNTKFSSQERLAEDIVIGHVVDMFPPLSPYIFIQILWKLEYDKILIESLTYMPFDLCIEILEIVQKCIEDLPFQRSMDNIFQLMRTMYKKFVRLKEGGIQTRNVEESIQNFLITLEEFMLLLTNPKLTHETGIWNLKKSERLGIVLKKLISTIKECLQYKTKGTLVSSDLERLYNVTFGKESFVNCDSALIESSIDLLNQKMMDLLLTKVKEVDLNIYLHWTEVDDEMNNMISLQRSIGNDCYYFIEFIQSDEKLSQNTHLIECLQQFSSKPDPKQPSYILSIQELCSGISGGKKELMEELLCRYKEWDHSVLHFVNENRSLLNTRHCLFLLQYLTFILTQPNEENFIEVCYTVVTKIISLQSVPDIYEIVTAYLIKHDGKNYLECQDTEETFNEFIVQNPYLQNPRNLKIVLLFLVKNLRLILSILVKITIGNPRYKNIMISATDMLLLLPFMQIREGNGKIFLISILRTICLEDIEWNGKKFMNFIKMIKDKNIMSVHDLINDVFIPYLEENTSNVSNINSILNNIRKLQDRYTKDINVKDLVIALARKMSLLRKNTNISKYTSSETIGKVVRILDYFLDVKGYKIPMTTKDEIIDGIEPIIEPIDKLHFASLLYLMRKGISVIDITEDYERRCSAVLNRLREDSRTSETLQNYLSHLRLLKDDFLRHLIIQSTEEEYHRISSELTTIYYFAFGWNNEIEAFNNLLRLTIEACCLSLEYPSIGGNNLFVFLLQSFIQFCKTFVLLEEMNDHETIHRSLIENINQLNGSINHSPYVHLFDACLTSVNNTAQQHSTNGLQEVVNILYHFCNQCLELNCGYSEGIPMIPHSPKITNFYVTHEIISACIKIQVAEAHECLRRLNKLFVSD